MQTIERIYRRAMLWARITERGYSEPHHGTWYEPSVTRAFLDEHGLSEEMEPIERRLLLTPPGALDEGELHGATWHCEPLGLLVWALGLDDEPRYDSDVAPFHVTARIPIIPFVEAKLSPRSALECEKMLRKWFWIHRRYHGFLRGLKEYDLRGAIERAGHEDLVGEEMLLGDDLHQYRSPLSKLEVDDLPYGRNWVSLITGERLRALKWLCADQGAAFSDQTACPHSLGNKCSCDVAYVHGSGQDADESPPGQIDVRGIRALHRAAFRGDIAVLSRLLASSDLVDLLDIDGRTALHCAIIGDSPGAVELLLDRGADLHHTDADGDPPLTIAVRLGRPAIAALLLAQGGDPDRASRGDTCALNEAMHRADLEMARLLLTHGACADGAPGIRPPILCAIASRAPDAIRLLAEHGADLDVDDERLGIPLLYALSMDAHDCADALLEHGADVDVADIRAQSPLHWAACQGSLRHVRVFRERGLSLDAQTSTRFTPLALALVNGHPECALELLAIGADPTIPAARGRTTLHLSVARGPAELVELLAEHGADVNAVDDLGSTPLLEAADLGGDLGVVSALLDQGADPARSTAEGFSPLHIAANRGNTAMVELLLARGADPAASARDGSTPLHCAAMSLQGTEAALLLAAGADPNARDRVGATPLHHAARGDAELVTRLLAAGAAPNALDATGQSPRQWAEKDNCEAIVALLDAHCVD